MTGPRTYYGVHVWPAGPNVSGIRWTASTGTGPAVFLKADTLEGIRELIRAYPPAGVRIRARRTR